MRIMSESFDENFIKSKHTAIDEFGTTSTYYRRVNKFAVIMIAVLSGNSSIHCSLIVIQFVNGQ